MSRPPYASLNLSDLVGDDPVAVAQNRSRAVSLVGLGADRLATMRSVHGADIALVTSPGRFDGVDAMVTQSADIGLMATGADCVVMAVIGADGRTIGAVHCGWLGLTVDVVGAVVIALRDLDTDVGHVVLGPAVCGSCYPVPLERAAAVSRQTSGAVAAAALVTRSDGQPGIDVRRGVQARLVELGVPAPLIESVGGCTVEDERLFSFRRDGVTGRQGIVVRIQGGVHE